jgi:hypothetical protein
MFPNNSRWILQTNPDQPKDDFYFGLYARRSMAAAGLGCGTTFGGDYRACQEALPALMRMFQIDSSVGLPEVRETCRKLGSDAVIVADTDPVWQDPNSWIWSAEPLVSNRYARAFRTR